MPNPIPSLPPVTSATRPRRSNRLLIESLPVPIAPDCTAISCRPTREKCGATVQNRHWTLRERTLKVGPSPQCPLTRKPDDRRGSIAVGRECLRPRDKSADRRIAGFLVARQRFKHNWLYWCRGWDSTTISAWPKTSCPQFLASTFHRIVTGCPRQRRPGITWQRR